MPALPIRFRSSKALPAGKQRPGAAEAKKSDNGGSEAIRCGRVLNARLQFGLSVSNPEATSWGKLEAEKPLGAIPLARQQSRQA